MGAGTNLTEEQANDGIVKSTVQSVFTLRIPDVIKQFVAKYFEVSSPEALIRFEIVAFT